MKKLFLIPLAATYMISCGSDNGHSSSDITDAIEDMDLEHAADMVVEDGANDIYEYNDALLSEVTLVEVEFTKLNDLDKQDIPAKEYEAEVEKSMEVIDHAQKNLTNIEPFGSGGEDFLDAVKGYMTESRKLMRLYFDYAADFEIPDEEWTDERYTAYVEDFEPAFEAYSKAYDNINAKQEIFASMNGTSVEESASFDAEQIYEETKDK